MNEAENEHWIDFISLFWDTLARTLGNGANSLLDGSQIFRESGSTYSAKLKCLKCHNKW